MKWQYRFFHAWMPQGGIFLPLTKEYQMKFIATLALTLFAASAFAHSSHTDDDLAPAAKKEMKQKQAAKPTKASGVKKEEKKSLQEQEKKAEAKKP